MLYRTGLGWDVGAKVFFQSKQSQRNQGEEEDCRLQEGEIEEETREEDRPQEEGSCREKGFKGQKEACKDREESGEILKKTEEETYKEEEICKGPLDHD